MCCAHLKPDYGRPVRAVSIECVARYLQTVSSLAQVEILWGHREDRWPAHHHVDRWWGPLGAEGVEGSTCVLSCMWLVHLDSNKRLLASHWTLKHHLNIPTIPLLSPHPRNLTLAYLVSSMTMKEQAGMVASLYLKTCPREWSELWLAPQLQPSGME